MKILGYNINIERNKEVPKRTTPIKPENSKKVIVPAGRVSAPTSKGVDAFANLGKNTKFVKPAFVKEHIPIIRRLYKVNEDLGSVLYDSIQLTNTGHKIKFDQTIKPELQDKMRAHLEIVSKEWMQGTAGIDGIINKWIAQIYVGGALSIEAIPRNNLTGLQGVTLLNPETIYYSMKKNGNYHPYQKVDSMYNIKKDYIKLNTRTYKYLGLFSDEDQPYGVPPFLAALQALATQKDMKDNIHHILNQMGLLGYLETRLDKPQQEGHESEEQYSNRLTTLLAQTKRNVIQGFKEGVVVGYQEDHEFEFHSTTKNLNGVDALFNMNENQIANGLKTSASFLGIKSGNTESFLSIVFTKMLSQLKNVQQILANGLVHVYTLELLMAGYDPKGIRVEFKPSTITDDLKLWQAKEIKQRVLHSLWVDRIISAEAYADAMEYQRPHKVIEPPLPKDDNSGDQKDKEEREKDKDKSDRRSRDKDKAQPKRKDNDTRER